jgi:hypothetical protein
MSDKGRKVAIITGGSQGIGAALERFGRIDTLVNNGSATTLPGNAVRVAGRPSRSA